MIAVERIGLSARGCTDFDAPDRLIWRLPGADAVGMKAIDNGGPDVRLRKLTQLADC